MNKKNIGVVLAGGSGLRFGSAQPKQFMEVAGKTVLEHTVDVFQASPVIHEIAIVIHEAYRGTVEEIARRNAWGKLAKILAGGKERYHSTLAAIRAYEAEAEADREGGAVINLVLHDAVRPLVSQRILRDVDAALDRYEAVEVAIPATDTIVFSEAHGGDGKDGEECRFVASVPDRSHIYQGQTPQAFRLQTIRDAYARALADPSFATTDDVGVVVKYLPGTPVYIVLGDVGNVKLTYSEDIILIERLFQSIQEKRGV